jgi:hypothetical protein
MVRTKFKCEVINPDTNGTDGKSIALSAVTSGSEENDSFFKFTPAGTVYLSIVDLEAAKQFEVGKEYYVDFTPAGSIDEMRSIPKCRE